MNTGTIAIKKTITYQCGTDGDLRDSIVLVLLEHLAEFSVRRVQNGGWFVTVIDGSEDSDSHNRIVRECCVVSWDSQESVTRVYE